MRFQTIYAAVVLLCLLITVCGQKRRRSESSYFDGVTMPRIAIIGTGIGGTSAAHKLRSFFGDHLKVMDIYEHGEIGGRMRTINVGGKDYELGGAVIHSKNQHMLDYLSLLELEKNPDSKMNGFALFSNGEKVYQLDSSGYIADLKMLWRYGWSLFTMRNHINSIMKDFDRIYKHQKEHQSFTTLPNMLMSMSDEIFNATRPSLRTHLKSIDLSDKLINEIVTIATRVNYGQTPDNLHGLVGDVSLAALGENLWSVKGGNRLIPEGLLKLSGAKLIPGLVLNIANISGDSQKPEFRIKYETTSGSEGVSKEYDVVILACPIMIGKSQIKFTGFDRTDISILARPYHHTYTYFIRGKPNPQRFGYKTLHEMPDAIFMTGNKDKMSSLALQEPADGSPATDVYKIFANSELSDSDLDSLFTEREETHLTDWLAYPEYHPSPEFIPFKVVPGFYYANAIEQAASAMEMSAISGINAALLTLHEWMGHDHLIDNMFIVEEQHIKIEL